MCRENNGPRQRYLLAGKLTVSSSFPFIPRIHRRKIKNSHTWSSHCGTTGSVVSWECWDTGSIPGLAQRVKDPVSQQLRLRSDRIPGRGTPYATGWPKKRKKKKSHTIYLGIFFFLTQMLILSGFSINSPLLMFIFVRSDYKALSLSWEL